MIEEIVAMYLVSLHCPLFFSFLFFQKIWLRTGKTGPEERMTIG